MNNNHPSLKKLEAMKGKTFQYANKIHFINTYSIDEQREKIIIKTNLETFERNYEAAGEFLTYWKECSVIHPPLAGETPDQSVVMWEQQSSQADDLINILKDNIAKVQADKSYIPQAQSINNNVNTIVNIAKMKMDFAKHVRNKK